MGPKLRTERPRKIKIGTEVAHVTRDSDTTFKVKRSNVRWGLPHSLLFNRSVFQRLFQVMPRPPQVPRGSSKEPFGVGDFYRPDALPVNENPAYI